MRKIVTIRYINDVQPIKDADQIEVVTVDGWRCVAKKGDLCVYFEIDSFLPESPNFDFLAKTGVFEMDGKKGYVLRTAKPNNITIHDYELGYGYHG